MLLDEIHKYVEEGQACFSAKKWPAPELAHNLGVKFHMLKGGAGFFGLSEVADHAAQLEKLLLKSTESMERKLEEAKSVIDELSELAKQLPPPKPSGS